MYPSVTTPKSGVPHLYYVSLATARFGASVRPRKNYPGDDIEQAVITHISLQALFLQGHSEHTGVISTIHALLFARESELIERMR